MGSMDWGKLLEQLQGQTKVKLQALDNLKVRDAMLGAGGCASSRDRPPDTCCLLLLLCRSM
jgi:hypothetical protein